MLRGIDPILSPQLLMVLRAMGHGDEIAIVDANFPATSSAQRIERIDGIPATRVQEAILKIMPLDSYVDCAAFSMQVVGAPDEVPPVVAEFQKIIDETADNPCRIQPIERFAFYDRARQAFAIVATGETRLYGNLILKKGVIDPDR